MSDTNLTTDDLYEFKEELMEDLKKLLKAYSSQPGRRWLKSQQVRKLLGNSAGTLQHLRVTGILPYVKIGGMYYYDYEDIQNMLRQHKLHSSIKK